MTPKSLIESLERIFLGTLDMASLKETCLSLLLLLWGEKKIQMSIYIDSFVCIYVCMCHLSVYIYLSIISSFLLLLLFPSCLLVWCFFHYLCLFSSSSAQNLFHLQSCFSLWCLFIFSLVIWPFFHLLSETREWVVCGLASISSSSSPLPSRSVCCPAELVTAVMFSKAELFDSQC